MPLTPKRFAGFYHQLLQLWLQELAEGHYVSIQLFDDLLNLLVKQQFTACGILGNCQVQYVIEADGSVYPCDFYVLDDYRMGYIQEQTLRQLFEQDIAKTFVCQRPEMPKEMSELPVSKMCRGGCKRMKRCHLCGWGLLRLSATLAGICAADQSDFRFVTGVSV